MRTVWWYIQKTSSSDRPPRILFAIEVFILLCIASRFELMSPAAIN